jgi:hypothetical protein
LIDSSLQSTTWRLSTLALDKYKRV